MSRKIRIGDRIRYVGVNEGTEGRVVAFGKRGEKDFTCVTDSGETFYANAVYVEKVPLGAPHACHASLCTRKALKHSRFCGRHRVSRNAPEGTAVVFWPSPVSHALYSKCPPRGTAGSVTRVALPGGSKTFLPGPGGGLLYVAWWDGALGVCGVSPLDVYAVKVTK